ncbi:DNA-3-methyladenine glycosylase 2 family protein [Candidatus Formimonas warabiya]|uniref:DNA-3-methyladenine glycosylase II n=1 Tax=Formimonas warabiya TaxID=1761012 RepID=A0A3G1KM98_FORW1|nr:DNA-3-methyladenine glycosylase 2 family protein [Candidatus Formimonas warabiya]ATW23581.1 adenosine deaminase [Candidatus Formimonas warabiya]
MAKKEIQPILLDDKACYAALSAHDTRFDGRFFVGVSSTGIYCRPVCPVKLPKEENCSYFVSAAAAEAAGYRPCLRCRPELAPGLAPAGAVARIARKAAFIMEEDCLTDHKISDLAHMLGITDRHLRRAFSAEYGVSPVQYLQTWKLLLAKNLLTDTQLSVTEVALIAGFGSIRRFNDLFKKHYRFTPSQLRGIGKNVPENQEGITLPLGYRPPYAWDQLISFLAARAVPGVESVRDGVYRRTVTIQNGEASYQGWVSVANMPKKNSLSVTLAPVLLPVLSRVLARIRGLFDVNSSPLEISEKLTIMNALVPDICMPGIRLPGCFDPFEMSVRAVLGQQVTVQAARTLAMRFAAAFGKKILTPFEELNVTFPGPDLIYGLEAPIENHLGPLGITGARARSIFALAEALVTGSISFSQRADPEQEMEKLLKLPGFGLWTVQYIGMRALNWPDAFPHTDYGVKKALFGMTPKEILDVSQAWRPWRSYATITLWSSLEKKIKIKKGLGKL